MSNQTRLLKILIGCLIVLCATSSFLAYRLGYARGSQQESVAQAQERLLRIAAYNQGANELAGLVLPLEAWKRNPTAFTPQEKERLKAVAKFVLNTHEQAIIPALERGESLEPWPLDLKKQQKLGARVKTLLREVE